MEKEENDRLVQADLFGNCLKEKLFGTNVKERSGATYKN